MTVVEIGTAAELVAFAARVNAGETTLDAKLTADIDMTGVSWTPIGSDSTQYEGVFVGNGHTISCLSANSVFIYGNCTVTGCRFYDCKFEFTTNSGTVTAPLYVEPQGIVKECIVENCSVTINRIGSGGQRAVFICGDCRDIYAVGNTFYIGRSSPNGDCLSGLVYSKHSNNICENVIVVSGDYTCTTGNSWINAACGVFAGMGWGNEGGGGTRINSCLVLDYTYQVSGGYRGYNPISIRANSGCSTSNVSKVYADAGLTASSSSGSYGLQLPYTKVVADLYHDKRFYDGTGIDGTVYLSWDFEDVWYWDSTDNLPKLQVFRKAAQLPFRVKTTAGIKRAVKGYSKTADGWKQVTAAKTKTQSGWR